MSVEELEKAVSKLPREELARFTAWFQDYLSEAWDRQMEADAEAGKLDKLIDQAKKDHRAGRTTPLRP
jgi:hypothetical protein